MNTHRSVRSGPDPIGTVLPKPYCSACGHDLTGAVTASACPECGRPLVEVLVRERRAGGMYGKPTRRYESKRRILGLPLVAIALGPDANGKLGHAKGYFAIGDMATGVFAFGGLARGLVAFGGLSLGGVTFGGLSLGTFAAFGGGAVAWLGSAVGGFAVGLLASGGGAVGGFAQGGLAIGWLARGATAHGAHAWSRTVQPDDATRALFNQFSWLLGPPSAMPQIQYGLAWTAAIAITVIILALLPAIAARTRRDSIEDELARTPGPRP
jgi:predicted RNA-binding Zn-ribbon protein involved in translation (DUF1610 family)